MPNRGVVCGDDAVGRWSSLTEEAYRPRVGRQAVLDVDGSEERARKEDRIEDDAATDMDMTEGGRTATGTRRLPLAQIPNSSHVGSLPLFMRSVRVWSSLSNVSGHPCDTKKYEPLSLSHLAFGRSPYGAI